MHIAEGRYLQDILDQPAALERCVGGLEPLTGLRPLSQFRQVVLTGMGGSLHAFHPLLLRLTETGAPVSMVETSELIHYRSALLSPETLLIVLSQSGRSAEIVRLIGLNRGRAPIVAVTNDEASPLAAAGDHTVLLNAGAEFTVSAKTYLTSLAALAWLGEQLAGGDLQQCKNELRNAAPAVAQYLAQWREHVYEAVRAMEGVERLYYVGRGPSLATVGLAGLCTKEAAHFAAEGMSAAAFRHGPFELVDRRVFLMVFEGDAKTSELNLRLGEDVQAAGGKSAVVRESDEPRLFHVPVVPAPVRQIVEILPVQMITLALAALNGREAGAFVRATKVTATE